MERLLGRTLGKYQIIEELGRGGMGAVFRAVDPTLQRDVAIKVLAPHLAWDEECVRRFLREAHLAARLRHPGIVTIHDVGHEGEWYYIVMQYLEGESLSKLLRDRGPLPPERLLPILEQLAAALDYVHQQGLVHRDVKPANVIVGPSGHVTLTDLGIAKALAESRITATGTTLGTPSYMAPEQITAGEVGPWTDLYALGVIAYECLVGKPPFAGDTTPAVLHKVVYEDPPDIAELRPDLPREVSVVLRRALAKGPTARFPSADLLVRALRQALQGQLLPGPVPAAAARAMASPAGQATVARPVLAGRRQRPPAAGDRQAPVWMGFVLLFFLIALVVVLLWGGGFLGGGAGPTASWPTASPTRTRAATVLLPTRPPTVVTATPPATAAPSSPTAGGAPSPLPTAAVPTTLPLPPTNRFPVIRGLSCASSALRLGEETLCTCDAQDPDGDLLSYAWYIDGRPQAGRESRFTFLGTELGAHTLRIAVTDGRGGEAAQEIAIQVSPWPPTATPTMPTMAPTETPTVAPPTEPTGEPTALPPPTPTPYP